MLTECTGTGFVGGVLLSLVVPTEGLVSSKYRLDSVCLLIPKLFSVNLGLPFVKVRG